MRLLETRVEQSEGAVRLIGLIERGPDRFEVYFAFPEAFAPFVLDSADPFVPALLVPALKTGEPLVLVPPVSPILLSRVPEAQEIYLSWFPEFRRVDFRAQPRVEAPVSRGAAVAALFSGGVDSFYTLLVPRGGRTPRPTHLLFFKGLEQPLAHSEGTDVVQSIAQDVARDSGTTLLIGESNIRTHFTLNYKRYYHGAALVAAALALSGGLRALLVPSGLPYRDLKPCGSHPLLEPLWSTERTEVFHDGAGTSRSDKIEALVSQPLALRSLRVCLENQAGPTNCGRCAKCVRTMLTLEILGVLPQATLFPPRLPPDVDVLFLTDLVECREDVIDLARRTGRRPDLTARLERASRRARRRDALRTLMETTPGLSHALPLIRRFRRSLRRAS